MDEPRSDSVQDASLRVRSAYSQPDSGALEDWQDLDLAHIDRCGPPNLHLTPGTASTRTAFSSPGSHPPAKHSAPSSGQQWQSSPTQTQAPPTFPSQNPPKYLPLPCICLLLLTHRTFKGIPDCWRASAWHAFLSASASASAHNRKSDAELACLYKVYIATPSIYDVQIDLDVPRTVQGHVLFRHRYSGGQRLLFQVLHSISLMFPHIGYVQGMASLVATLLCYYNEESAFIMLVRMFQERHLDRLYEPGFTSLKSIFEDFNSKLSTRKLGKILNSLGIHPSIYLTTWYLTLFNYSVPFHTQLRMWDIFMLLDDPDSLLQATSLALLHSLKHQLVNADFERAMDLLSKRVLIENDDVLMRRVKIELNAIESESIRRKFAIRFDRLRES
ncbi:TBC domain-containing protein [Neolecta irregularis DAH-3]|uniref:TBC domain-containing protein n=1 Tax=Neolecta irregularis (strain DAH-3) TaxID=1198029 RepID=A0A1U7LMV3_NEOID|nr:TBC domain-containing protein [Neolecta irregularis DAH-3]|eukprot:OLL23984.1 TBC domain-containing protein [Neolecta irregularis DAH-3]